MDHSLRTSDSLRNVFGLFRRYLYPTFPSHDPEDYSQTSDLLNFTPKSLSTSSPPSIRTSQPFHPYPNENAYLLGEWQWNHGEQKTIGGFRDLIKIVGSPQFRPEDVRFVNWARIDADLSQPLRNLPEWQKADGSTQQGWCTASISISVPFPRRKAPKDADIPTLLEFKSSGGPQTYVAHGFYYRPLLSVIQEKVQSIGHRHFHHTPYELHWQPNLEHPPIRVYGELYTSAVWLEADAALQAAPPEPGCNLPRVIVAIMLASDETHLTSFGSASLWPLYMYFGNDSKYKRAQPTAHLCEHAAYFLNVRKPVDIS